jgi:RIO kinase 2
MKIGAIYRMLTNEDFHMLAFFTKNLRRYEYIPLEVIVAHFKKRYSEKEIIARVRKLTKLKLIERHPTLESYRLRFLGLDIFALHLLVKKNVVKAIGDEVGTGKESKLYLALSNDDKTVVLKFHRIWRSFRNIVKVRSYGENAEGSEWLVKSIVSGRREREALSILNQYNVDGVPKLYGGALHAVVIDYIPGIDLYEASESHIEDPERVLQQIIDIVKEAYSKAKIVHGDLSEYNVRVDIENAKAYIIDWPQYVSTANPVALQVLRKDMENILKFFRRKFRVERDINDVLKYITEGR